MKIESIIRRRNGTRVELGGVTYHFRPEVPGGPHVAEVSDQAHIERLLSIPEGFRAAQAAKSAAPTKPAEPVSSADSDVLPGDDGAGEAGASDEAPAEPRVEEESAPAEPVKRGRGRPPKAK